MRFKFKFEEKGSGRLVVKNDPLYRQADGKDICITAFCLLSHIFSFIFYQFKHNTFSLLFF